MGTGTEAVSDSVGSWPSTYQVHLVGEGDVWRRLAQTSVNASFNSALENSTSASAVMLRDVVGNARAAAALAEKWSAVGPMFSQLSGPSADRVWEAMFPGLLVQVVLRFKQLNGLKALDETQTVAAAMESVQVVMNQRMPGTPTSGTLMTKYGIVTDRAMRCESNAIPQDWVRVGGVPAVTEGQRTFDLVAPIAGRYRMTPAQVAFVRLRYGMGPQPVTGDGFERLFKDYLILASQASIAASRGNGTSSIATLTASGPNGTGWTSMRDVRALLDATVATGVAELDAVCPIQPSLFAETEEPNNTAEWSRFTRWTARINQLLDAKKCVIAANVPKAESFDSVWLEQHRVIFLQYKKYDSSVLRAYTLAAHLYKLGCRHWTCCLGNRVNNVAPNDVGTLFGQAYVNDNVNHKKTHVHREKLFHSLLKDSSQSRLGIVSGNSASSNTVTGI